MKHNRVLPLILIMGLGCLVLLWRLYTVQVLEHDIWAREALGLTYSGQEIPYRRGTIRDTHGNVLARSKSTNHVALIYRDFRREHYLGQLAHARSLMEQRAVGLPEARANGLQWARELLELTPLDLKRFSKGQSVRLGSLAFEATKTARAENRPRRAKDIGFYARYLLNLDKQTRGRLEKLAKDEGQRQSFLELAVRVRRSGTAQQRELAPKTVEEEWAEIAERIQRFDRRLGELAALLFEPEELSATQLPVELLVDELEAVRRWVENQTASKLFGEAAQFVAGRVEPDTLIEYVDLDWIARLLSWDATRLEQWARGTRTHWQDTWLAGYALPRLNVQLQLSQRPGGARPDDFLSRMAGILREKNVVNLAFEQQLADWRDGESELLVVDRLEELFDTRLPAGFERERPLLPFQNPELQAAQQPGGSDWSQCLALWPAQANAPDPEDLGRWILHWRHGDDLRLAEASAALVAGWDRLLQEQIRRRLAALQQAAKPSALSADGRLIMAEDWRERAAERAEYFLKDYGRRARSLVKGEPDYEIIYRLTRFEDDYPGFFAREAPKREYLILEGDQTRMAPNLVGGVSSISIRRLVKQQRAAKAMARLKANPSKSLMQQEQLSYLVGFVELPNESRGYEGVEGYWDRELSGLNGFREVHGLDGLKVGKSQRMEVRERENGKDLTLTLDSVLQRSVQAALRDPYNGGDPAYDQAWYAEPVGAVVLLSVEGDILAAVSEPDASSIDPDAIRTQRKLNLERTFRAPTFQPPGSVFKPFVAAYMLSAHGFDPRHEVFCGENDKGRAGYKKLDCWNQPNGHGSIPLYDALVHSCNAYFAFLGESMGDEHLRRVVSTFGFDQGSGVKSQVDPKDRLGFVEDLGGITALKGLDRGGLSAHQRMMVGNGLAEMVATPISLARATLGLATGTLIDLRLVRKIDDQELPLGTRNSLDIDQRSLQIVREAMRGVVTEGTARKALSPSVLGLDVAAKTGSADLIKAEGDGGRVRKHTWVIGWLPYAKPELVFVVFVHDTRQTSSHGAIYLTQQVLQQPAVLDWLDRRGVDTARARELRAKR